MHDAGYTIHDKENHTSCIMNRESCIVSHASCIMYLASLFSAVLAMKTKEIAFTLPIIIVLYEFMFFNRSRVTSHESRVTDHVSRITCHVSWIKRILYLFPFLLTVLVIPLSFIGIDKPAGDMIGEIREASQETGAIPRWSYLFTQFRVIATYVRLLFFPINQNLDYDYPAYHSFFSPNVFLSFMLLLSIFG
ncbi:MAG: hypothetical protein HY754_07655, partial [Nitrospirae bacterium]|nr:hypothetical protein [Nitrospirota bacterium]